MPTPVKCLKYFRMRCIDGARYLYVTLHSSNLTRRFIATVGSKAQMLEELELVFEEPSSGSAEVSAVLRSFAKLRKLAWSGDLSAHSLRNMLFHALTHIYVASHNITQDVVACLSQCTAALEVRWELVNCWESPSVCGLPQITLHHLQSLNLVGIGDLAHILSRLTLPSLKCLRLQTRSKTRDQSIIGCLKIFSIGLPVPCNTSPSTMIISTRKAPPST